MDLPAPSRFVDAPFLVLLVLVVGLRLWARTEPRLRGRARATRIAAWTGTVLFALASSPWFALGLAHLVEPTPRDLAPALASIPVERRALVVLSGGIRARGKGSDAPPDERLSGDTASRVMGAARIYRGYGFGRVVVTGAGLPSAPDDMAEGMAALLVSFGVPRDRIVLEPRARDTRQNARYTLALVAADPPAAVVVVTSAYHLPRALWEFRRAGTQALGAPVDFSDVPREGILAVLPSITALALTERITHELLGYLKP